MHKAFHIRRRLTADERVQGGLIQMRDIRGTEEYQRRLAVVWREVPKLRGKDLG